LLIIKNYAYATNKPINAPKVVVLENNWEPNIELVIVGDERSKIHQFLWAYKDGCAFGLKNLGSFKGHEI
jgi:hypothetical protein